MKKTIIIKGNTLVLSGASTGNLFEAIRTGEYPFRNPASNERLKHITNVIITDSERGYSLLIPFTGPKSIKKFNSADAEFTSGDSKNQNPLRYVLVFDKALLFNDRETMNAISNVWDKNTKTKSNNKYDSINAGGIGYCKTFVNVNDLRLTKCGASKVNDYKRTAKKK